MIVLIIAAFIVSAVVIFLVESSGSSTASQLHDEPKIVKPKPSAPPKMPPLNVQQQAEVKRLAAQQAASLAAQALAAQEQAAAQKAAAREAAEKQKEAADEAKKQAELREVLTVQPTDSPAVRQSIGIAQMRQNAVTYNQQRIQYAESNLQPLEQWVGEKQAAYNAEDQQYLSWKNKLDGDEALLNEVISSKQAIAQRLAQLKVLGRWVGAAHASGTEGCEL